jgi:rhodanese-related sulfurtransferase
MSRYIAGMARAVPFPLMILAAVSVALAAGCETTTRDTDIKIVSVGEAKALWDRASRQPETALFLDPRPLKYYDAAHIPAAHSIQLHQMDPKADRDPHLERYSSLIVYGDDPASPVAKGLTKRLMAVGYKGVRWFAGGMKEWNDRGYPVEPPRTEAPAGASGATGATGATGVSGSTGATGGTGSTQPAESPAVKP